MTTFYSARLALLLSVHAVTSAPRARSLCCVVLAIGVDHSSLGDSLS